MKNSPSQSTDRDDLDELKRLSVELGENPALVQGAGGNTSIKTDGVLFIKASGKWLMHANQDDIMVPVRLAPLLKALSDNAPSANRANEFVIKEKNPSDLRPSIETTLHAVLPQRIVVHVHCVETIAIAAREDAESTLKKRLKNHHYAYVPYTRPGLPLARKMMERRQPDTNVMILGNHGMVVAADTVQDAKELLNDVSRALQSQPRSTGAPERNALEKMANGSDYRLPDDERSHAVACDPVSCAIAAGGSLYPDHVIFLGAGSIVARDAETIESVCARISDTGLPAPASILFPGKGVLMHKSADKGAQAMAKCLSDVTARIPQDAPVHYLSLEDNAELLNWDAEKYRKALNKTQPHAE